MHHPSIKLIPGLANVLGHYLRKYGRYLENNKKTRPQQNYLTQQNNRYSKKIIPLEIPF